MLADTGGQDVVPAETEVVVLPSRTWAASVIRLSQGLSAPDPAPSCGVR